MIILLMVELACFAINQNWGGWAGAFFCVSVKWRCLAHTVADNWIDDDDNPKQ